MALAAVKGDRTMAQLAEHFDVHAGEQYLRNGTSFQLQGQQNKTECFGPAMQILGQWRPSLHRLTLTPSAQHPAATAVDRGRRIRWICSGVACRTDATGAPAWPELPAEARAALTSLRRS